VSVLNCYPPHYDPIANLPTRKSKEVKKPELPSLPTKFEYRLDLRQHVTPHLMFDEPIHRWFVFPHSYSPKLVDEILQSYPLPEGAKILDSFVGAGTTVLRAKQKGFSATGTDLSPLSVFVTQVKIASYDKSKLNSELNNLISSHKPATINLATYPERIRKAFSQDELAHIEGIKTNISLLPNDISSFFLLALLSVQQQLSRAVPDGGWFRWVEKENQSHLVVPLFERRVQYQLTDLPEQLTSQPGNWQSILKDARKLDDLDDLFGALVTSPPYPNRHDYSRIFHMELLSLGSSEEDVFKFRHSSIRSHVEAHRPDIQAIDYKMPQKLQTALDSLPRSADSRISPMLKGYFEDMYLCLKAAESRLIPNGTCAFVVGNVRHAGVMVLVDEILAEVGEQAGLKFDAAWVARMRGNSAQQMALYGREPSRETILIFKK
jgi:tRNA G10  N-methylase Trm11